MRNIRGIMANPFKNPIKPTKKEDGEKEWSFKAPTYDNRTSCSIPAGDDYGVGFRTPVGKEKPNAMASGPIPQKAMSFKPDDVIKAEK